MRGKIYVLVLIVLAAGFSLNAQATYKAKIEKWRVQYQVELIAPDSWLTLAGLFWLKDGVNTIGSGANYDVQLTDNFKQGKFGEIAFSNGMATQRVAPGVAAKSGSDPISQIELVSDENGKPTKIDIGSETLYLIKREDRYGIRLRDTDYSARTNFKGLHWYRVDPRYQVTARFVAFPKPKDVDIPNVLGGVFKMKSPGILYFTLLGKRYTLQPVTEEDHLFIIFKDPTSRTETYGAGRFLYAAAPKNGRVVLDFNKAENPPCAYTTFATCPLPPRRNRLDVEIKAGEKRYHD
jgi:hypothetical protein